MQTSLYFAPGYTLRILKVSSTPPPFVFGEIESASKDCHYMEYLQVECLIRLSVNHQLHFGYTTMISPLLLRMAIAINNSNAVYRTFA